MQDVLDGPITSSIKKQKTLVPYVPCKIHRTANRLTSASFLWKTVMTSYRDITGIYFQAFILTLKTEKSWPYSITEYERNSINCHPSVSPNSIHFCSLTFFQSHGIF